MLDLEAAKIRRYEALQRHGDHSPQFTAASNRVAELEAKVKAASNR